MRHRSALAMLLLVVGSVGATRARAADPLDAFPEKAAIVWRIASLDALLGNSSDMFLAIDPKLDPRAMGFPFSEQSIADGFAVGQDPEVLDHNEPLYAALFVPDDDSHKTEGITAYLVRTPDEERLRRAVLRAGDKDELEIEQRDDGFEKVTRGGLVCYFRRHGDYVLYTRSDEVVEWLAFDREQQKSFTSTLDDDALAMLNAGDAAVAINAAHLTETYRDDITRSREEIIKGIEQIPDKSLAGSGIDAAATRKMYVDLVNLGFDAVHDSGWAVGSVDFGSGGVELHALAGFAAESRTDALLERNPPSPLENFKLLPAGAPAYFALAFDPELFVSWTGGWLRAVVGQDRQRAARIESVLKQFADAGMGQMATGFKLPAGPESGMIAWTLMEAEEPAAMRAAYGAYQDVVGTIETPVYTQKMQFKPEAETYNDLTVDVITVRYEFPETEDPAADVGLAFVRRFFGGDGLETRMSAVDNLVVQASGNDPKYFRQLVDGLESGEGVLGNTEAYSQTRDRLGELANVLVLLNLPQLVVDGFNSFRDVPPFDAIAGQVPFNLGIKPDASYLGIALGTQPHALRLHAFVPVAQPKGIMRIFAPAP